MRVVLDKLTEIFCDVDDFATVFMPENGNGEVTQGRCGPVRCCATMASDYEQGLTKVGT